MSYDAFYPISTNFYLHFSVDKLFYLFTSPLKLFTLTMQIIQYITMPSRKEPHQLWDIFDSILRLSGSRPGPDQDVALGLLPMYHSYGLVVTVFGGIVSGSKVIYLPKFQPETFFRTIEKYKVSCHFSCLDYLRYVIANDNISWIVCEAASKT